MIPIERSINIGVMLAAGLLPMVWMPLPSWADVGQWLTIENPGFVFKYRPGQEKLAKAVASAAGPGRERMEADLGKPHPGVLEVRIADGPSDFQDAQPKGYSAPVWAAGIAYQSLDIMVLQARGGAGGGPEALESTFLHELSHLLLHHAVGDVHVPRWLAEGMAMYHANQWSFGRAAEITRAIAFGNFIRLEKLDWGFPDDGQGARLAYAESMEFFAFLMGRYGRAGMNRLISGLTEGKGMDAASEAAYGLTLAELEKQWTSRTRLFYAWIPLIASSTTLWFVITAIFLLAYLRKRAESKRRLAELAAEDRILYTNAHEYGEDGRPLDDDDPRNGAGACTESRLLELLKAGVVLLQAFGAYRV
jgi:hypothetical protein